MLTIKTPDPKDIFVEDFDDEIIDDDYFLDGDEFEEDLPEEDFFVEEDKDWIA